MRAVAVLVVAKWLARLIATLVFPAPPFGLITSVVFILITGDPPPFYCRYAGHHATCQSEMQPRPPVEAASIFRAGRTRRLFLRQSLNGEGTEFRVLVADFAGFLEFLRIAPGLYFFHAVPDLHDNALLGRRAFDRGDLTSCREETTAGRFDRGLGFRDVLLHISVRVRHVDLRDVVDRRLGLSVESFDHGSANSETGDDCQRYCVPSFHGVSSPFVATNGCCVPSA